MIRTILTHPDPVLRQVSAPVGAIDDETRHLLDDMLETMYAAQGRGLAAVQVGVLKRVVVIDIDWKEGTPNPLFLVDPEVVWASPVEIVHEERCLSLPDTPRNVRRPDHVRVRHRDRDGIERTVAATGMLAVAVQHEVDHLDGVLIVDHARPEQPPST